MPAHIEFRYEADGEWLKVACVGDAAIDMRDATAPVKARLVDLDTMEITDQTEALWLAIRAERRATALAEFVGEAA